MACGLPGADARLSACKVCRVRKLRDNEEIDVHFETSIWVFPSCRGEPCLITFPRASNVHASFVCPSKPIVVSSGAHENADRHIYLVLNY